jgi:hypothetical protein
MDRIKAGSGFLSSLNYFLVLAGLRAPHVEQQQQLVYGTLNSSNY